MPNKTKGLAKRVTKLERSVSDLLKDERKRSPKLIKLRAKLETLENELWKRAEHHSTHN